MTFEHMREEDIRWRQPPIPHEAHQPAAIADGEHL